MASAFSNCAAFRFFCAVVRFPRLRMGILCLIAASVDAGVVVGGGLPASRSSMRSISSLGPAISLDRGHTYAMVRS